MEKKNIKIDKENPYYDVLHAMSSKDDLEYESIPTSIYEAFKFVIEKESTVKTTRAIKIEEGLTYNLKDIEQVLLEVMSKIQTIMFVMIYFMGIRVQVTLPFLYIFPENEKETQNSYISQMFDHIPSGSSTKYIRILGNSFYIYRLSRTGSKIVGLEKYIKNKYIYTCLTIEHMCVLECIYISVYKEEYKKAKGYVRAIIQKLKKIYQELFNKPFSENEYLDGLDLMKTLKKAFSKFNLKFIIYGLDENDRYEFLNSVCENGSEADSVDFTTHYLFLLTGYHENKNKMIYVMYIKDLENFMKLHVCPKCGYIPPASQHGCYIKTRFEDHFKNCNGKIEKKIMFRRIINFFFF
jgi:hypothetical protein